MKLNSFKADLRRHPDAELRFVLPDGTPIPEAFHVTEVGHVVKNFIDCGGTVRRLESCLLQAWVAEDDREHRLTAGKLARILELARSVVPSDELEVEVEYDRAGVGQYHVGSPAATKDALTFPLQHKQTDCLARAECGVDSGGGCGCRENAAGKCC